MFVKAQYTFKSAVRVSLRGLIAFSRNRLMFMDFIDFLNGRGEVVIFSTDDRNLFPNNFTYGPVVFGSRRLFAATAYGQQPRCSL